MAAVHVGTKRTYQQMRDADPNSHRQFPLARSERSPPAISSRITSRASTPLDASVGVESSARWPRKATFEPSASLVLIGIRGVGKSTLGVLAAAAYNRTLVDSDRSFSEATGSTTTAYRKLHGTAEYQRRHNQILENTLKTHRTNAVLVCTFSDLEGNGANLIREYGATHPVILVTRDAESIQSHLQVWPLDRINELLEASSPLLRSCSNFEFFNLLENGDHLQKSHGAQDGLERSSANSAADGSLTLKRAERDVMRLLRNAIGDHNRGLSHQSAYPLSSIRIESRNHTFSVSVNFAEIRQRKLDFDELQIGSDCIELIVDNDDGPITQGLLSDVARAFAIVRRATILPVMISPRIRSPRTQKTTAEMLELLNLCFRLGPEFCTVDLSLETTQLRQIIVSKGETRLIGALEWPFRLADGWESKECLETYKRAAEIGCDLVKLTMPAETIDDAFAVQSFRHAASILTLPPRLIAYSTGSKGRLSKCFNNVLTPVDPHLDSTEAESSANEANAANASITAKAITQALFSSFVLQPLQFFVFGADVSHSLSPAMHKAGHEACGMQYDYSTYSSDKLEDFLRLSRRVDFGGSAVAHPFKTTVAGIMDGLSPHAKAIGAVNTVVPIRELAPDGSIPAEATILTQRREQGPVKALYGFNSGIRACIRRGLSPANTIRPHSSALVCGAGGMARSAIYSLISLGVRNIFVCNRNLANAVALIEYYRDLVDEGGLSELTSGTASQIQFQVLENFTSAWPSNARQPTIIVNCIPRLDSDDTAILVSLPESWLKSLTGGVIVEVAYRLPVSSLIQQIRERAQKWIVMDGYDVLPEQAYTQFELLTGRRAPRKLMREAMLEHCNVR